MTEKQELFIAEYLINGFNATQAAIIAGYSEKTAYSIGNELLKKPEMRKAIQKHVDSSIDSKKVVLKKRILDQLSSLAFENDEIKHNDQIKALELLGKYMAMFTDKQEIEHSTIDKDGNKSGIKFE